MKDMVQFWCKGVSLACLPSSHAPDVEELVNIKGETYEVLSRSYTVDDADDPVLNQLYCNVYLGRLK